MAKGKERISRDKVRENAQARSGGATYLRLPEGVSTWKPTKKGTYELDVLPYEVTAKKHPDGVERGEWWYKRLFTVHHNLGGGQLSAVCPLSVGKPCPIHEKREKLRKNYEENKEQIQELGGKTYCAMNLFDPESNAKGTKRDVKVYVDSHGKFWAADAGLKAALDEADEENLGFFGTEGGKTLKVTFKEDKHAGHTFLKATRIDFEDRSDFDTKKVMSKVVNLDEILEVLPYDKLKELFNAGDEDEDEKPRKKGKASKSDEEEDDEEEDDDDEDSEDEDEEDSDDDDDDDEEDEDEDEDDDEDDD